MRPEAKRVYQRGAANNVCQALLLLFLISASPLRPFIIIFFAVVPHLHINIGLQRVMADIQEVPAVVCVKSAKVIDSPIKAHLGPIDYGSTCLASRGRSWAKVRILCYKIISAAR